MSLCLFVLIFLGGLELFRQFLRSEYSEENLEFWIACEEYRTMRDERQLVPQAQKIFTDFVAIQAPREVSCCQLILMNIFYQGLALALITD
jgi:regulator of G-protein signaling 3